MPKETLLEAENDTEKDVKRSTIVRTARKIMLELLFVSPVIVIKKAQGLLDFHSDYKLRSKGSLPAK